MTETTNNQEPLVIKEGLSAIALPELGRKNDYDEYEPATPEETLKNLNSFLKSINQQGADIVSIMDVKVEVPPKPGIVGSRGESRKFVILRKKHSGDTDI